MNKKDKNKKRINLNKIFNKKSNNIMKNPCKKKI